MFSLSSLASESNETLLGSDMAQFFCLFSQDNFLTKAIVLLVVRSCVLTKREETGWRVGEGPQRDSPSLSLSTVKSVRTHFPVGSVLVLLVVLPVRWDRSVVTYCTTIHPAGIPL
jgi:hypothetical protein